MALAHLAGHIYIWEKVHLYANNSVPLAGLAPPSFYVKREASRVKTPKLGLLGAGKELPDIVEQACVGGRVGPWGPANGRLVNLDHLIQEFQAPYLLVGSRKGMGPVQLGGQLFIKDLIDQRGFA